MTASYRCETQGISLPLRYSDVLERAAQLSWVTVCKNTLVGTDSLTEVGNPTVIITHNETAKPKANSFLLDSSNT